MKIKEFQKELARKKIDAAMFFNFDGDVTDPNMQYFSQYTGFGGLVVTQKKALLIAPRAEYERARKTSKVKARAAAGKMSEEMKKVIKKRRPRIGIDKNRISLNFYKSLKKATKGRFYDISVPCMRLRTTKTKEEIEAIKKSCRTADGIMKNTLRNFKRFKTESEVAAHMINETNRIGLEIAFKPTVASGGNACQPHYQAADTRLKKGFCVIDFGVRHQGYCSDISRTVYVGKPSEKEIELYSKVLDVQTRLIQQCKAGRSFIQIHQEALRLFGKHAKHFTHLIGHGIGVEIHESPNPKKTQRRPVTRLLENSVITIEPGLYFAGKRGIRIEDDVLITKKGPEVLTRTGKNLLVIRK
jgi:Xaa-Pro aminopeptidase